MTFISIINLFGGVGLFLFGMSLMGSSLQKLAGGGLEKILETLTTSKKKGVGALKGFGLGVGVTGIIQSSAATTLMLIGFVNAGIMKLTQSIPVVFGANVGSTFTAQILRLGDLASDNIVLKLLKPSSFAPMLLAVGMLMIIITKKYKNQKVTDIAHIMIGLGLLFYGMTMMEEVFAPLKDSPAFRKLFTSFSNPLIGILTGIVLTAIIQSSSAAVGILQALSASGSITYGIAFPFILGQNIGKCMPIVLGAIGAAKKAKRVSITYIIFNIFSTILFAVAIYSVSYTIGLPILDKVVNRGNIANVHLGVNLITSLILLPFCDQIAKLSGKMTGDSDVSLEDEELKKLDDRLLKTPGIALSQCINISTQMCRKIMENFTLSTGLIREYNEAAFETLEANESFLDKCETALSAYIVRIDKKRLTNDNKLVVSEILHSISDFERIGDYCMNIAFTAKNNNENDIVFSETGLHELDTIISATGHLLETLNKAFIDDDGKKAVLIEPLTDTIKTLKDIIKSHHVERLKKGDCGVAGGIALADLTNSFERIASHSTNIGNHIIKRVNNDSSFDEMHGHLKDLNNEEYKALKNYYQSMYLDPVINGEKPKKESDITDRSEKSKAKDKLKLKDKAKSKDKLKDKDKTKENDKDRTKDKDSSKDKDKTKDKDKEKDKNKAKDKDKTKDKTKDKDREKDKDKAKDKDGSKDKTDKDSKNKH